MTLFLVIMTHYKYLGSISKYHFRAMKYLIIISTKYLERTSSYVAALRKCHQSMDTIVRNRTNPFTASYNQIQSFLWLNKSYLFYKHIIRKELTYTSQDLYENSC